MGCCESCMNFLSGNYSRIPDEETANQMKEYQMNLGSYHSREDSKSGIGVSSSSGRSANDADSMSYLTNEVLKYGINLDSSVFQGISLDWKFVSKLTYEPRFVWVTLITQTINISRHVSKERSHKQADLNDITSIVAGPPTRYRRTSNSNDNEILDTKICLTINFKAGGGIDLKFPDDISRDIWYQTMNRIVVIISASKNHKN